MIQDISFQKGNIHNSIRSYTYCDYKENLSLMIIIKIKYI